jgi:hypothetical protein
MSQLVKLGHSVLSAACPVFPRQRTLGGRSGTSETCQEETSGPRHLRAGGGAVHSIIFGRFARRKQIRRGPKFDHSLNR